VSPDATATIIYTFGTTGLPKGAELSHTALLHTGIAARTIVPLDHSDVFLSFLPLSHIIERVGGHYLPLTIGAHIVYSQGVTALKKEITGVRPTVFLSVPRVFEYIQEAVFDQLPKQPPLKQKMFHIAVGIGDKVAILHSRGKRPGPFLNIAYGIAKKLVLEKVRERVTGGRDRFFVSGGAPLNAVTAKFFNALGVCLLEGYGLTECPVITLNRPGKSMPGTVGQVIPGMEVKIAEDGEILSRGPSRMRCYNGNPQATADAIDSDGWFHTGDIGNFDDMQRLRIVDRKKDIIVLANGKNVAPLPIEALLKSNPMIQEAVLIGDKQATISALIIPNWDQIAAALPELSISAKEPDAWLDNADVKKLIRKQLDTVAGSLADFERVKQFRLLAKPFSIEGGELTPTLKVKRKTVQEKYASLIAEMSK
ncbi:MAG: AMP-dependent synthetase/ligase, partial [Chthonomonadales bacterium]